MQAVLQQRQALDDDLRDAERVLVGEREALSGKGHALEQQIQRETRTLPIALYSMTQVPGGEGGALRLMILSIVIAMLALFASEILARRVRARLEG